MEAKERKPGTLGVLMIDFSPVVREGLQSILAKDTEIEFMGDVPDGNEAIQYIKRASDRRRSVNVVLTETRKGKVDGVQATRLIKDKFPEIAVLVLAENMNDSYVIDAIHAGAGGYIFLQDMSPEILLQSIHRVAEGGTQMTTELLRAAVENLLNNGQKTLAERTTEAAHLTAREIDVLRLMGNGDSNKIIAESLGITMDTAKKHVRNVIDKMQAHSRTHAAIIAAQTGLVGRPVTPVLEAQSKPRRVLVVDDEPAILGFIRTSLKANRYEVITASDGTEALQLLESEKPDIVLLDILMPGKDGFQVLHELRTFSKLPVIVFSARDSFRDRALSLGADDFIAKPFAPDQMVRRIKLILEAKIQQEPGRENSG
jgi:DNA-binding NarL/FixJ family response regulator